MLGNALITALPGEGTYRGAPGGEAEEVVVDHLLKRREAWVGGLGSTGLLDPWYKKGTRFGLKRIVREPQPLNKTK